MSTFTNEEIANVVLTDNGVSVLTNELNDLNARIDAKDKLIAAYKEMIESQKDALVTRDEIIENQDVQVALLEKLSVIDTPVIH